MLKSTFFKTDIASANLSAAIRDWNQQAHQCLGNNDRFVRGSRAGFSVYRQRTDVAANALEFLLPDPDQAFEGATILKHGSRNHAGVVKIAGVRYVLKRYNCRGWSFSIGNAFRRSRAVRTWLVNWQYWFRGVPVPEPLLCLEERRWRLLLRSYILMEFVEDTVSLRARWGQLVTEEKRLFIEFLAGFLGRMHRVGMLHGDLKWDNLLVGSIPSPETVRLVDLDGSSVASRWVLSRARKDFDRFLKDLTKYESIENFRDRVIHAWEKGGAE